MSMRLTVLVLAVAFVACTLAGPDKHPRFLTMQGFGSVSAKSDRVTISGAVSVTKTSVSTATKAVSKYTKAVHEALLAVDGLSAENITTTNVMIHNEYTYHKDGEESKPTYRVQQSLQIVLNSVLGEFVAKVIDAMVVGAGDFLQLHNIDFGLLEETQAELMNKARKAAAADATQKAELYAEALGLRLGDIAEVSEGRIDSMRPMGVPMAARSKAGAQEMSSDANFGSPMGSAESGVTAVVTIVWEIHGDESPRHKGDKGDKHHDKHPAERRDDREDGEESDGTTAEGADLKKEDVEVQTKAVSMSQEDKKEGSVEETTETSNTADTKEKKAGKENEEGDKDGKEGDLKEMENKHQTRAIAAGDEDQSGKRHNSHKKHKFDFLSKKQQKKHHQHGSN